MRLNKEKQRKRNKKLRQNSKRKPIIQTMMMQRARLMQLSQQLRRRKKDPKFQGQFTLQSSTLTNCKKLWTIMYLASNWIKKLEHARFCLTKSTTGSWGLSKLLVLTIASTTEWTSQFTTWTEIWRTELRGNSKWQMKTRALWYLRTTSRDARDSTNITRNANITWTRRTQDLVFWWIKARVVWSPIRLAGSGPNTDCCASFF